MSGDSKKTIEFVLKHRSDQPGRPILLPKGEPPSSVPPTKSGPHPADEPTTEGRYAADDAFRKAFERAAEKTSVPPTKSTSQVPTGIPMGEPVSPAPGFDPLSPQPFALKRQPPPDLSRLFGGRPGDTPDDDDFTVSSVGGPGVVEGEDEPETTPRPTGEARKPKKKDNDVIRTILREAGARVGERLGGGVGRGLGRGAADLFAPRVQQWFGGGAPSGPGGPGGGPGVGGAPGGTGGAPGRPPSPSPAPGGPGGGSPGGGAPGPPGGPSGGGAGGAAGGGAGAAGGFGGIGVPGGLAIAAAVIGAIKGIEKSASAGGKVGEELGGPIGGAFGKLAGGAAGTIVPAAGFVLEPIADVFVSIVRTGKQVVKGFEEMADTVRGFSGEVAAARAGARVQEIEGYLKRADQIGSELGEFTSVQGDINRNLIDIRTELGEFFLPAVTDILRGVNAGLGILRTFTEGMNGLRDLANEVADNTPVIYEIAKTEREIYAMIQKALITLAGQESYSERLDRLTSDLLREIDLIDFPVGERGRGHGPGLAFPDRVDI